MKKEMKIRIDKDVCNKCNTEMMELISPYDKSDFEMRKRILLNDSTLQYVLCYDEGLTSIFSKPPKDCMYKREHQKKTRGIYDERQQYLFAEVCRKCEHFICSEKHEWALCIAANLRIGEMEIYYPMIDGTCIHLAEHMAMREIKDFSLEPYKPDGMKKLKRRKITNNRR